MKSKKYKLLEILNNRPILIWGARMTGIGFLHFARKNNLNTIGFVDSDPYLAGKNIGNLVINKPDTINALKAKNKDLIILIAVSIKEDEIANILKGMGLTENDFVRYSNFCGSFFTIDVVGSCNLKCPSCAHANDTPDVPKGFMSLDDFKKVTEKMMKEVDLVSHVCLYSWGEPFLHPELNLMIEHIHEMGIAVAVSTNLSIESSDRIKKVVKTSPDYLKISLSGYYPEVYNSTHTGGDINLVKSNLYKLKYYIDKHGLSTFVEINYHLYNNNYGRDLEKMKELCDELGFALAAVYANVTPVERLVDYCEGRVDKKTEELSKLLLVGIDKGLEITKSFRNLPCRFLTNQININWDRSVPICCVCFYRENSIISDDYLKDSLEDIESRKKNHPFCKKCIAYGFPPYLLGVNQKEWEKEAKRNMSKINSIK